MNLDTRVLEQELKNAEESAKNLRKAMKGLGIIKTQATFEQLITNILNSRNIYICIVYILLNNEIQY
jgi:hypothetical protein